MSKDHLPKGCKAHDWPDPIEVPPPPKVVQCVCGCDVPTDVPCHCGTTFKWVLDPYDGWHCVMTGPPMHRIRGES